MTRTRSCTNILTHIHTGCSIHCSIKVMFQHTNKYFLFQDYPSWILKLVDQETWNPFLRKKMLLLDHFPHPCYIFVFFSLNFLSRNGSEFSQPFSLLNVLSNCLCLKYFLNEFSCWNLVKISIEGGEISFNRHYLFYLTTYTGSKFD